MEPRAGLPPHPLKMSSSNPVTAQGRKWVAAVRKQMGSDLIELNVHDLSITATKRGSGFHAVVRGDAAVNPNLGLDAYGETTAIFKLKEIQNGELMTESSLEGALAKIDAVIPQESADAFGAHLLGERPWIADSDAVATLGISGKAGIVAEPTVDDMGSTSTQFYVMVTVSSPILGEQADAHYTMAAIGGRSYTELMSDEDNQYNGTTPRQVFGADSKGRATAQAIMLRAAVTAAETIGAALGLEFESSKWDGLVNRDRPQPDVINTTNFMRPGPNGTVEIFASTIPVDGPFVYDFGGVSSMALVHNCAKPVVSVKAAPSATPVSFGLDYGARSAKERLSVDRGFTWEGKADAIGSPVLSSSASGFKQRYVAAKAEWGGETSILINKRMKVVANDARDQPVVAGDLLY